jgi:hypothetical protein
VRDPNARELQLKELAFDSVYLHPPTTIAGRDFDQVRGGGAKVGYPPILLKKGLGIAPTS